MDELIKRFNQAQVRYLVVGGQAMRLKAALTDQQAPMI